MATSIGRRRVISALGSAVAAWPFAALGQQVGGRRHLGVLVGFAKGDPESERWLRTLLERLRQLGWGNDKNLDIDLRWGGMDLDKIKRSAKELVEARPDVIQVTTTPATAASCGRRTPFL
jgi:hypothetical protein